MSTLHPTPTFHSPTPADVYGLPTYSTYKLIENAYLCRFPTVSRQDKALMPEALYDRAREILVVDLESCVAGNSKPKRTRQRVRGLDSDRQYQLRFWARCHFKLGEPPVGFEELGLASTADDSSKTLLTSAGFVVPAREQVYEILCGVHLKTGHGGLDEMNAVVSRYYSPTYITRRLVKAFVNACPTCRKTGERWHELRDREASSSGSPTSRSTSASTSPSPAPSPPPPTLDRENNRPDDLDNVAMHTPAPSPSSCLAVTYYITPLPALPKTSSPSCSHSEPTKENSTADQLFNILLAPAVPSPSPSPALPLFLPTARNTFVPTPTFDFLEPAVADLSSQGASWFPELSRPSSSSSSPFNPSSLWPDLGFVGMKSAPVNASTLSSNAAHGSPAGWTGAFSLPVYGRPPPSFQMRDSPRRVHPYHVGGERRAEVSFSRGPLGMTQAGGFGMAGLDGTLL